MTNGQEEYIKDYDFICNKAKDRLLQDIRSAINNIDPSNDGLCFSTKINGKKVQIIITTMEKENENNN